MAGYQSDANWSALLRGMFGAFQTGAAQNAQTADIWSSIRDQAGAVQFAAQGVPQPYDPAALQAAGAAILSAQGVGAANVSTFRGIAGEWLGAKQRLQSLDPNAQILPSAIFTSPWAVTTGDNTPSRYRLRTQWQTEDSAGNVFTGWKADEITGPLTNTADLLDASTLSPPTTSPKPFQLAAVPPVLIDYELEQI